MAVLTCCTIISAAASPPAIVATGKTDQQRFRWKDQTIRIAISSSLIKSATNIKADSDVLGAIRRSLQAWQDVANIEFQIDSTDRQNVSPAGALGDGISVITIAQTPENVLFFGGDSQSASAKTRVFYNRKGIITEADVVLSPFQQFSTDGTFGTFDLQSTLTHEIGHLLGLRHSGVVGSAMTENLAKVGSLGYVDFGSRNLSESDIAAVRDLYGSSSEKDDCCATVSGKLTFPVTKSVRTLGVWAEDSGSGRVVAQAEVSADGRFRIGGIAPGTYSLYWTSRTGTNGSSSGDLGSLKVDKSEAAILNQKITFGSSAMSLEFLGLNSQLGESSISIEGGREQMLYIGGKGLDAKTTAIEFASPFLHVATSPVNQDFGDDVSVISIFVKVDPETPPGVYSIFARGEDGTRTAIPGGIRVN